MISHSASPPTTDSVAARYLRRSAARNTLAGEGSGLAVCAAGAAIAFTLSLAVLITAAYYSEICVTPGNKKRSTDMSPETSPSWCRASTTVAIFFFDTAPVGSNRFLSCRNA